MKFHDYCKKNIPPDKEPLLAHQLEKNISTGGQSENQVSSLEVQNKCSEHRKQMENVKEGVVENLKKKAKEY